MKEEGICDGCGVPSGECLCRVPETADQIRARHYDCFYADWEPKRWTPGRCAAFARGGVHLTRCKRKSGYGIEGLFCRQHEGDGE